MDSMVCLHWLHKYATTFEKLQKLSVFSTNRLRNIDESCRKFPVTFKHIKGELNPGDYVTKPFSYRRLSPDYYTGPQFLKEPPCKDQSDLVVTIPNPDTAPVDEVPAFEFSPPASLELVSNTRESPMVDSGEENKTQIVTSQVSQCTNQTDNKTEGHLIPLDKYSSFSKLVRIHTNILRFINKLAGHYT